MKKKHIAAGTVVFFLGVVGAGIGGYSIGYDAGVAHDVGGEQEDNSTATSHTPYDVRIVEIEEHTNSMDEAFRSTIMPEINAEDFNVGLLILLGVNFSES